MITYSNNPLPVDPQKWKDGEFIYFYNHKDNGVQVKENEGSRYSAEFVITNSIEKTAIEKALTRSILDPVLDKCVVENIEVDKMTAINVVKIYKTDAITTAKIAAIITPVKATPDEGEILPDARIR
jgi:hypothetical protein